MHGQVSRARPPCKPVPHIVARGAMLVRSSRDRVSPPTQLRSAAPVLESSAVAAEPSDGAKALEECISCGCDGRGRNLPLRPSSRLG